MTSTVTSVSSDEQNVDERLRRFGFTRDMLRRVALEALEARLTVAGNPNYPRSEPGHASYSNGVRALREQTIGRSWALDEQDNICGVRHVSTGTRVVFANVDQACEDRLPVRISEPGPKSLARLNANRNQQRLQFEDAGGPIAASNDPLRSQTWHLMVGVDGSCELSLLEDERTFVERIFVLKASDIDPIELAGGNQEIDDDPDIDVLVERLP